MNVRHIIPGLFVVAGAAAAAQGPTEKTLQGTISIKSGGGSIAVYGKAGQPATDYLFCIDQDRVAMQKIEFAGSGRVLYRSQPIEGVPAGVTISGPEPVANTLTVIADDGKAWTFVARGEKPLMGDGKAAANATRINATVVRRLDWSSGSGPRRGTDVAGCLQPAG